MYIERAQLATTSIAFVAGFCEMQVSSHEPRGYWDSCAVDHNLLPLPVGRTKRKSTKEQRQYGSLRGLWNALDNRAAEDNIKCRTVKIVAFCGKLQIFDGCKRVSKFSFSLAKTIKEKMYVVRRSFTTDITICYSHSNLLLDC